MRNGEGYRKLRLGKDLSCAVAPGIVSKDLRAYLQECFTENRAGSTRKNGDRFLSFIHSKGRKMKQVFFFKGNLWEIARQGEKPSNSV